MTLASGQYCIHSIRYTSCAVSYAKVSTVYFNPTRPLVSLHAEHGRLHTATLPADLRFEDLIPKFEIQTNALRRLLSDMVWNAYSPVLSLGLLWYWFDKKVSYAKSDGTSLRGNITTCIHASYALPVLLLVAIGNV